MRALEHLDPPRLESRRSLEALVEATSPLSRSLELDRNKLFDDALCRALAQAGMLGLATPKEQGGSGGDTVDQAVMLEVLGRRCASMAVHGVVSFLVSRLLRTHGSTEQQEHLLRPLLRGDMRAAFCLTESGGGTDILANTHTIARRHADGWTIDGEKTWVSGAVASDVFLVVARTSDHRTRGLTVFAVPSTAPGIGIHRLQTMALSGLPSCTVRLQAVIVPESAVVGQVDEGLKHIMSALNGERINAAAVVNGIARGALEAALEHARSRQAFGKALGQFQAVQHRLATCAVSTELAWSAVLEAARRDAAGEPTDVTSGMAKWVSSKAALAATDVGMELMAASGFLEEGPMQRYFRHARLHRTRVSRARRRREPHGGEVRTAMRRRSGADAATALRAHAVAGSGARSALESWPPATTASRVLRT